MDPEEAYQPAVIALDEFTCQALDLPTRDNNAKGLFTGRGMNAKFMTCSMLQFGASRFSDGKSGGDQDESDALTCSINSDIEDIIDGTEDDPIFPADCETGL